MTQELDPKKLREIAEAATPGPWCGYQYQDSFEFEDDGEAECYGCEKRFKFSRIVDVTYDTEKIES